LSAPPLPPSREQVRSEQHMPFTHHCLKPPWRHCCNGGGPKTPGHTSGMSVPVPILSYQPPPQGNPPGGGLSLKVSESPTYSEKKGHGSPQGNPKLIKQSVILAAPALVKHSFPRKLSELGVTALSLFQGTRANKTAGKRLRHNLR
jgi:hypothetical protein